MLLIALGLLVAPLGPLLVGIAGALQLDPELAELNVPLEVVRTMSSIGVLALFGGVFQLVAGIGVLLLRRWARTLGIGVALVSAIAFGLAARRAGDDRRGNRTSGASGNSTRPSRSCCCSRWPAAI